MEFSESSISKDKVSEEFTSPRNSQEEEEGLKESSVAEADTVGKKVMRCHREHIRSKRGSRIIQGSQNT